MTYLVEIKRNQGTESQMLEGEQKGLILELSATNLQGVKDFLDLINAGTDVSTVITAIDAL